MQVFNNQYYEKEIRFQFEYLLEKIKTGGSISINVFGKKHFDIQNPNYRYGLIEKITNYDRETLNKIILEIMKEMFLPNEEEEIIIINLIKQDDTIYKNTNNKRTNGNNRPFSNSIRKF